MDVAIENSFKLNVNSTHITTFLTSPRELEELAAGFLLCEGFVTSPDDIISMKIGDNSISCEIMDKLQQVGQQEQYANIKHINSAALNVCFETKVIFSAIEQLKVRAKSWRRTGGTHLSMVCNSGGEVLVFCEDVSRACSVDKTVGKAMLSGIDLSKCVLVTTGRLSVTMIAKAARAGFPLIASKAAPLSEGIRLADEVGMTLVAFARKPDLYVYTGAHRVI
ncbi:MAG: formate dehydrogenase accessory sulfurtransferase FdhD [ANME-2 cluster archaeon]|nr:formate dehydrogenase accessory sulfurtransferase FdhD [ANME-2 cluster archaeon]